MAMAPVARTVRRFPRTSRNCDGGETSSFKNGKRLLGSCGSGPHVPGNQIAKARSVLRIEGPEPPRRSSAGPAWIGRSLLKA
jgi:hypothetical protein